ncbi:MAG: hypothetical protein ACRC1K_04740 [Planctomycetia bacterium]
MAGVLAIVGYRCWVAGVATGSLDVQVRWFDAVDETAVRRLIEAEPDSYHAYSNVFGEVAAWERIAVFAVEPFEPKESGAEVVGFIAGAKELFGTV